MSLALWTSLIKSWIKPSSFPVSRTVTLATQYSVPGKPENLALYSLLLDEIDRTAELKLAGELNSTANKSLTENVLSGIYVMPLYRVSFNSLL